VAFGFTIALSLGFAPAYAQIRINEIFPNPVGSSEVGLEWIEIYNSGVSSVDVTGWAIDDAVTIGQTAVRARIPEDFDPACSTNPVIGPGEFRVIRPTATSINLNNSGDDVYLVSNRLLNATVVQQVTYPATVGEGQSLACIPNGTTSFAWRTTITQCATNGSLGGYDAAGCRRHLLRCRLIPRRDPPDLTARRRRCERNGLRYMMKVSHSGITWELRRRGRPRSLDHETLPQAGGTPRRCTSPGAIPTRPGLRAQDAGRGPEHERDLNSPGTARSREPSDPDLGARRTTATSLPHSYSDGE
jgi:hypothetical protein